ncbi:MAG: flagellar biosynthetic protein FliO [Bdellovibrio sp.]
MGAFVIVSLMGIGATLWVRKMKMKQGHRETAPSIKMLNQLHLSPKKSIALIRVAGESILVGITDQNISHLKTLSLLDEDLPEIGPQEFRRLVPNPEDPVSGSSTFESQSVGVDLEALSIQDRVAEKIKNLKVLG